MTSPGAGSPEGSLGLGLFAERQAMTEADAKDTMKTSSLSSWNGAHEAMRAQFISADLFGGEVVRLDNRIDEIVVGSERAFLYTYSESAVWDKHPAAYKVVVDVLAPATGGRSPGVGGYSGGWHRLTFTGAELEALPASVAVTIGAGAAGGGGDAPGSSFGTFVVAGGATTTAYGTGNRTYKMRGGDGGVPGSMASLAGKDGSDGPFHDGASGGAANNPGGHGFSSDVGQIGPGSAGGGGGGASITFTAGKNGGHGGWPSAPGGGGGSGSAASGGAGGNGGGGAVFVTVYVEDTLGVPPSTPTGLAASSVTATAAHVEWDASTDDVMVKNYIVYLNGSRYAVVDTTFHDFVGLTASTSYSVRIQAVDMGENASEMSDPLTFSTTA